MRRLISSALKSHGADYVEIRIEDHERTRISFRGKQVDELKKHEESIIDFIN